MGYIVYEEDLDDARDEAIAALRATRSRPIDERRYDWLYRGNPDGQAVLWSIRKEATGEMAGFTVVLPRRVLVDGQEHMCWNGADFSIHRKYRALGVAVKLRRAAKEAIDQGRADFLYAHPNAKMQLIHERAGHWAVGAMVRYAKPLKAEAHLRHRIRSQTLAAVAGKLVEASWGLARLGRRYRYTCDAHVVESPEFDDRFDRLFAEAAAVRRVVGVRDARYLRWRYGENPLCPTQAVLAEEGGRLLGYALFTIEGDVAHLKDVLVADNGPAERDLVARLIEHARRLRLTSVSAVVLEGHPIVDTLNSFGFSRRPDGSQMFGYARREDPLRDVVSDPASWLLSVGDRDV